MSDPFDALKPSLGLDDSGRLRLRGQEMILLPRHFFRFLIRNMRDLAGPDAMGEILGRAGHDGAHEFCRRHQELHGGSPGEVVAAYLDEMSLRGWGRFELRALDPRAGRLEVELTDSAMAAGDGDPSGHVIWRHAMCGAMDFVREAVGASWRPVADMEETGDGCRVSVYPDTSAEG